MRPYGLPTTGTWVLGQPRTRGSPRYLMPAVRAAHRPATCRITHSACRRVIAHCVFHLVRACHAAGLHHRTLGDNHSSTLPTTFHHVDNAQVVALALPGRSLRIVCHVCDGAHEHAHDCSLPVTACLPYLFYRYRYRTPPGRHHTRLPVILLRFPSTTTLRTRLPPTRSHPHLTVTYLPR